MPEITAERNRRKMLLRNTITVFLFTVTISFSQNTADFLILSSPRDYTILNQYQQRLTKEDEKLFVPLVPLKIENDEEVLGDQITKALRVGFGGRTWFIQKDESGNLLGDRGKQFRQIFKKCAIINDTVLILADRTISFSKKNPPSGENDYLKKGEYVARLFSYGGQCYIRRSAAKVQYGWGRFGAGSGWKRVEQVVEKQEGMTDALVEKITERFKNANKTYAEYFAYFDSLTGQEKTVPVWRCEAKGNEVHCELNAPYKNTGQLDESTRYLVRDVENMLIGKKYDVVNEKGDVIVRPRVAGELK
jgi:hypothetical protein